MVLNKNNITKSAENLDQLPLPVIWIFKNKLLYYNKNAASFLKIKNQLKKELDCINFFERPDLIKIEKAYLGLLKNKKEQINIQINSTGGKKNKTRLNILSVKGKKILQLCFLPKNETIDKKKKPIQYKEKQLRTLFETSDHLVWMVNKKFELTNFNENFKKIIELKYDLEIKVGFNLGKLLSKKSKDYSSYWHGKYSQAFNGLGLVFTKEDFIGKKVYKQIFINPIIAEGQEIKELCCIAHDVTDSFVKEKKISDQKKRLNAIFDSSQHYVWSINKKGQLTSFNKNYFDLVTNLYGVQPYLGFVLNRGVLANDKQYTDKINQNYQRAFSGKATNFELETYDQENRKIYLEVFLNPIFEKGRIIEISGIAHDITEKKNVHQKMEISLKEKEVLLKEVHHRVKNNMQVISSILNLQSFYVKDEYALSLLKESQNRISTMATVHESLYQNNNFSFVNFSDYLKKLTRNIISSYTFVSESIELKQDIEEIALSLDLAIPLGLIINELITNSIKHAFPNSKKGTITISLKNEDNNVHLELSDDGIGLKKDFSIENCQSLGLQLVSTLMEQIDAKHKVWSNTNEGTKYNISFLI